ncbi:MAG: glycosyltransferase family 4 protein [Actinobacteria bacterium]|nr:glycosyltransferase family 4 protein [Actinomycetota bacterium]
MRVGLVCPYSLTIPGGVQGQVLGLARELRSLGHHVRVLAPCDGPPPDAGVTVLGRSVPFASNGSVAPLAPDVSCALRTIRAIRDEKFDVLYLHEPLCPGPTVTALFLRDAPMIGTFHRSGPSGAYAALRPIVAWGANRLDLRCAVSEEAQATARDALGGEYDLLFNGIEIERFAKATPAPTAGPTILFVGRHEERKGLAVLLAAMGQLPSDVHLWVTGEGPQTEALRAAHGHDDRIDWLGRVDDDHKASLLVGADVFCAPSLHGESFGVVLLEAMAARTPIVASDIDGYRLVARAGTDALLVPPDDAAALAAGLTRVLTDGAEARRLVASGELRAAEFSMTGLAEQYAERYRRVLRD